MTEKPILYEVKEKIGRIILNRPENRNSMDQEVLPAFKEIINQVQTNKSMRCLIITGSGDTFCAGAAITAVNRR